MDFLIRTKENRISGPFPKEEIVARIGRGELREQDEVCPANGYWIFLHERAESKAILGVELPRAESADGEESTETETETATATATGALAGVVAPAREHGSAAAPSAPERTSPASAPRPESPARGRPETLGAVRFALWAFLMVLAFILFRVFQLAQDA